MTVFWLMPAEKHIVNIMVVLITLTWKYTWSLTC